MRVTSGHTVTARLSSPEYRITEHDMPRVYVADAVTASPWKALTSITEGPGQNLSRYAIGIGDGDADMEYHWVGDALQGRSICVVDTTARNPMRTGSDADDVNLTCM